MVSMGPEGAKGTEKIWCMRTGGSFLWAYKLQHRGVPVHTPAHSERTHSMPWGAEAFPPAPGPTFRGGLSCMRDCQFSPFSAAIIITGLFFVSKSLLHSARVHDWCLCDFRRVQNWTQSHRRCPLASPLLLGSSHFVQSLSFSPRSVLSPKLAVTSQRKVEAAVCNNISHKQVALIVFGAPRRQHPPVQNFEASPAGICLSCDRDDARDAQSPVETACVFGEQVG